MPGLGPSGLSMSPPAVVAGASSAASRAAYDTGALRRLSLRSGQSEGEEVISSRLAVPYDAMSIVLIPKWEISEELEVEGLDLHLCQN